MKVIILAAGLGTRLRPMTDERPKCMVPLCGKPMLMRQIDVLRNSGLNDIILLGGYRADRLTEIGYPVVINKRYAKTNMVSTLFCAEEHMKDDEDLLITYGDIIYEEKVLQSILSCKAPLCVSVDREWKKLWQLRLADPLSDAETLKLVGNDKIVELGKKPKGYDEIQGQYMGLIKVSKNFVKQFKRVWNELDRNAIYDGKNFDNMYMTSFIQHLINENWDVRAAFTDNGWLEVDSYDDLKLYETMQKEGSLSKYLKI